MIKYNAGGVYSLKKICQCHGSVFPKAMLVSIPCSAIAALLTLGMARGHLEWMKHEESILKDNAAWGGFNFLVGFLIVFRTSQSYTRFCEGATSTRRMRAEWFDACSSLVSFTKHSRVDKERVGCFQNTLVRLFSMLHAAALGEIEDSFSKDVDSVEAFNFELIDVDGIDPESLEAVRDSFTKVELIFQWIQQLIVENIDTGVLSIPAPILSRSFQEIANGMVAFHDSLKISCIPFPFPYAQVCDFILVLHWVIAPFVICQWVSEPQWAAVFTFAQSFVLWALNFIAVELENPFGMDVNDFDGHEMQTEMNEHLLLLMRPSTMKTPDLSDTFQDLTHLTTHSVLGYKLLTRISFCEVWRSMSRKSAEEKGFIPQETSNSQRSKMDFTPDIARRFELSQRSAFSVGSADSSIPTRRPRASKSSRGSKYSRTSYSLTHTRESLFSVASRVSKLTPLDRRSAASAPARVGKGCVVMSAAGSGSGSGSRSGSSHVSFDGNPLRHVRGFDEELRPCEKAFSYQSSCQSQKSFVSSSTNLPRSTSIGSNLEPVIELPYDSTGSNAEPTSRPALADHDWSRAELHLVTSRHDPENDPRPSPVPHIIIPGPMDSKDPRSPTETGGWYCEDGQLESRGCDEDGIAETWPSRGVPSSASRGYEGQAGSPTGPSLLVPLGEQQRHKTMPIIGHGHVEEAPLHLRASFKPGLPARPIQLDQDTVREPIVAACRYI